VTGVPAWLVVIRPAVTVAENQGYEFRYDRTAQRDGLARGVRCWPDHEDNITLREVGESEVARFALGEGYRGYELIGDPPQPWRRFTGAAAEVLAMAVEWAVDKVDAP
jgi:hypothetical protein